MNEKTKDMSKVIGKAHDELSKICQDTKKFRMCIPVQEDDSDMILRRALRYADRLEESNKKMKKKILENCGCTTMQYFNDDERCPVCVFLKEIKELENAK